MGNTSCCMCKNTRKCDEVVVPENPQNDNSKNNQFTTPMKNESYNPIKNDNYNLRSGNKGNSQMNTGKVTNQTNHSNRNSNRSKKEENESKGSSEDLSKSEEDGVSPEEQAKIDAEMRKMQAKKKGRVRAPVCAEVYGEYNKKKEFVPRNIPKTEKQKKSILDKIGKSFIFNSLEENDLNTVLAAFEEKRYKAGQNVITEGEQGDVVYLVDQGQLDCEKTFKKGDPPTHLKGKIKRINLFLVYQPGESFGELALLYNAPRAATIRAKTDCVLWALDRECFNNIVKGSAIKKREKNEETLKKVDLLSTVDAFEIGQIADALKSKKVSAGTSIIKQGDQGNEFYILEHGKAYAAKSTNGKKAERVFDYSDGSYFGELALLNNAPRAASIIAETDCSLLYLDRGAFKRLLGPLEQILQRNSEKYSKYIKKK